MPFKAALCSALSLLFAGFTGYATAQSVPRSSHVWVISEENHSYEDVVGSTSMPYYNELIQKYGLATQFYSNTHNSLPANLWFVAGAPITTDTSTITCQHSQDNLVRELLKSGYTWRAYEENLPYAGFQGVYSSDNLYYRRHNPLIDFTDDCPGTGQDTNSVPFPQMATDWSDNKTVNFAYITPDVDEDSHSSSLSAADQWLQANLPGILARPEFQAGGDGILFIVWDEGNLSWDNRCSSSVSSGCGGRTPNLVIGPQVKQGYKSTTLYHNQNVLKTVCAAMGLATCPGAAATATPMAEFFNTSTIPLSSPTNNIVISSPATGATIAGQVRLVATASESVAVSQTQVWDNGVKLGVYGTSIDATYSLAPGTHTTTVIDLSSSYQVLHKASVTYTVESATDGVQIIAPTQGESLGAVTVNVVAHATEAVTVKQMQVWDNGVKLGYYAGADVNQYYSLAPGSHTLAVFDLDSNYNVIHKSTINYSVQ